ncbi:kielin/chordin-like protein [Gadus chalcogrammus]|uniref:kielin/chordin-like protein n=1 Tax=Gadus chalcogrammus TaxID=1042646 RepID=UPI0024C4E1E5|nr:kielin/chordin-like protein [Gadus chalcogrammus]
METGKLRTLLFLEINVFILSTFPLCLQGQSTEHVIDLLAALNMSQPIKGISKIHDEDPSGSTAAYKLRPKAPHLTLPPEYSRLLASAGPGSLGVHLVARQAHDTSATLLSFSSRSSTLLQLVSSTRNSSLRLDRSLEGPGAAGLLSLFLPGGSPFSGARWARLALGLEPDRVSLFVDCEEAVVVRRRREERVDLRAFPRDLRVTLGSAMGDSDSKFSGYLKTAEISLKAYGRRPWHCPNITDGPPSPAQPTPGPGLDPLVDQGPQRLQKDSPQRGAALGPPGHPQGGRLASPPPQEERLRGLEQRLEQMAVLLDAVQAQNTDLQSRVHYLEGCECVRRRKCTWEGREVEEGHRWQTLSNTACTCTSGQVACEAIVVGCDQDGVQQNVSTADGCVTCTCRGGQKDCAPVSCPRLLCSQTESVPGECCQRCKGCVHTGVRYESGSRWRPALSPCDACSCEGGQALCERESCGTSCTSPASAPADACCPVCDGCGLNGRDFPNGASVPFGDRCQTCTCVEGNIACAALPCPTPPCLSPVHRHGDCCPSCGQCDHGTEVYQDGQDVPSGADPCLRCRCSAGEVSCERLDASCPSLPCSHPAKPRGQCCPSCDRCEYDRRVFADGQLFQPPGGGPCLQCRCKGGNVVCHTERCPPTQCSNPIMDPHYCCPICKACVLEDQEYEEGARWRPEGPCSSCACVNGETVCTHTQCPPTECLHPAKNTGSCCAVCESCTYNNRIYGNGQRFVTPDQPCLVCTCQYGSVECLQRDCPAPNCTNPHTPPGECCPTCPDCSFENRVFVDGEAFPSPVNVCERCVCADGRVECRSNQCPRPNCNAPAPGTCCQNNCNGCRYAGKEYPNGQEFPHPTDKCRACTCINGNVQCLMKRCPPLQCTDPNLLPGECCPQCPAPPADCVYEQRSYRHTERFYHPTDTCRSCLCTNGMVQCKRKPCPSAPCSHPITQDCCPTCEGCLYERRERADGERWADASDACSVCTCRGGSARCEKDRCPPAACSYPVQRSCCTACDGCLYKGQEYPDGYEFVEEKDPCSVCSCYSGEVVCSRLPCDDLCRHPHTAPGQCCGECDRCSYNNLVLINGQTIPDPSNPCSECTCQRGSVVCVKRQCSPARCPHPVTNPCGCPACEGCLYQGVSYLDGQLVSGGTGGCQDCTCSRGAVACVPRRCPAAACAHPALDGCSCPVCVGCRFTGRDRHNGERFPHPADRCQRCSCLNGGVLCVAAPCPAVSCGRPVTPPGGCCPVCTGSCRHEGGDHPSGSSFTPSRDPCSSCTCLNAEVSCQRRPCPLQCSHPVPSESCCPACDSCLYQGGVHAHRHTFGSSSDPCQRCTCVQGTVTCVRALCPPAPCPRPVTLPGQCCPRCPVCMLDGREYQNGQQWTPQSDPCSTCTCQEGEVRCVSQECPTLPCMHQVQDPGTCCPRCRGCMYDGREHAEASSWFADSASCMNCMCVGGVTTCSQIRCISPCVNTIRVAGECCPLCADCLFEGRVYSPRDSFHPADDPCQICTCEVMPDGEQHLRCYRKQCPSLVDCPVNNILFSGPESCCPVCAQPLSNCTATLIGNEVLATDDPCFTCQCKDLTWTCLHRNCPPLTCPVGEQLSLPDSCCPVCEECVIEGQDARVPSGSSWTDSDDDCVTCTCNLGHIECSIEECLHLVCQGEQIPMKTPGKCCYECQASGVSCTYQGALYQPGEQWAVDECTGCTCVAGDVHCGTERCPPLACSATEMPAAVPGVCCPHCLPRPATCIAFGDPHYRTFDGRMLHFQGACTYVLAQDCQGGHFRIHATNDDRGRKGVSWTKEVTVFIGDLSVQLLQDWVVKVNGRVVALPYLREPYVYVERQTNTILLNTNIGIKVLWSGRSHLEVSVPGSYRKQTCGLCGDFNDFPQDDLRMPDGRISLSEASFGNSWQVTNHSHALTSCRPGEDVDPCREAGYQARKGANGRCKVLKSSVFKPCHRVVPPEAWHGACVYDLCACGANTDECLCDALEAYAGQCREAGVVLDWRSPALCAVGCPVERGFVFDECGPPCPVTCLNADVPLGVIESHCFKPCVPGCQCPAGLVLHSSHCVAPDKCPKIIHGNATRPPGAL